LRHDPDIIMVGEIRDVETAEIAIQAALTGHLVFSTLHTNDAAGAFSRLLDMGVEPFLVSSSLSLSVAQRLVRRLCPLCKQPYEPSPEELHQIGIPPERLAQAGGSLNRPVGCKECTQTGYSGRTAIYEMLAVDDDIRNLVMQRADASTIRRAAEAKGMHSMREDGIFKILKGMTSVQEVLRVTHDSVV
ncbi:MAG: ATPase, T2SS/T4P/T4SS family, partial [Myxococcota bacterium]|nr:ATPase, T2SS/T4P/T4SS family [Myxococcota bacterium]